MTGVQTCALPILVAIAEGEYGISPGQACVLYDGFGKGARVLGGGFISLNRPRVEFSRSNKLQTDRIDAR